MADIGFNPRTHTGCDYACVLRSGMAIGFNPRTHTGCDSLSAGTVSRFLRFNPRTHTGCDSANQTSFCPPKVSIHAPTRGATFHILLFNRSAEFQSTHPHGVRQYIFQSADFLTYTLIFLRTFHGIKLKSNRLTKKRCNWFIISECDWYTIYVPL